MMEKKTSTFKLHKFQNLAWRALFKQNYREVALISGVQGGKTSFGVLATRVFHDKYAVPGDNIIIGAPTFKTLEQSLLPAFLQVFTPFVGSYNGKNGVFRTTKGVNIWFRTGTDPDSAEGIPDCIFAWMDEAGKCPRKFWVNFQGRVARRRGAILYTTTWYALNWLFKELWKPFELGKRKDLFITSFNSAENPTFPEEELDRQRTILSPAEFQRKYMGEPGKVEGMVFHNYGENNWCEPFDTKGMEVYGGIDWGFNHPMAVTIRAVHDKISYTVRIFKKSGLSVNQVLDLIESMAKTFNVKHFYCGHDRPDMISELNKRGVPCSKYFEGNEDYREVNAGNQLHAELIANGKYKIFRGIDQAEDLDDEYLTYAWKETPEGSDAREAPVNINDDLMAAERYCTIGIAFLLQDEKKEYKLPLKFRTRVDTFDPTQREPRNWDEY